jgi:hypothetical protein
MRAWQVDRHPLWPAPRSVTSFAIFSSYEEAAESFCIDERTMSKKDRIMGGGSGRGK